MKAKYILCGALATASMMFSSCSDFFDQESKHVIFTDDMHIDRASDSIFSLTGIMLKMQALGDRTVLLGEVRGDLVDVTNAANADLRQLAQFNISDDNKYNSPKDYYAVINNCNLYLAKADTAIRTAATTSSSSRSMPLPRPTVHGPTCSLPSTMARCRLSQNLSPPRTRLTHSMRQRT